MYDTAAGLIDSTTSIIQPQGYSTAYPIFKAGNSNWVLPIPNQAGGVYVSSAQGLGVNMGYFKSIYSHLKFDYNFGSPQYILDQTPDVWFRYDDGTLMQFNASTINFAANGRYIVADNLKGFVKIDILNLGMRLYADTLPLINYIALAEAATTIDGSGKYAVVAYNASGGWGQKSFNVIDTDSCTDTPHQTGIKTLNFTCNEKDWSGYIGSRIPGLQLVGNVQFVNDRVITFDVYVSENGNFSFARYSMVAAGQKKHLLEFLAMGDSFISGEGAFSYKDGTDTSRNQCHQSTVSYPYLIGLNFNSFASVACSGAKIVNITGQAQKETDISQLVNHQQPTETEKDTARISLLPGFQAQSKFAGWYLPEAVILSLGGNDIGFKDIVTACVSQLNNGYVEPTCRNTYEERASIVKNINEQFINLRELYKTIIDKDTNNRRLYVVGYPQIANPNGDCGVNVFLNKDELQFSVDLINYLNLVIQKAAAEAGAFYVDTTHAFDGHRLCEGTKDQIAVNGLTFSKKEGSILLEGVAESYHPNRYGHELLAETVAAKTHNLTVAMPAPNPETGGIELDPSLPLLKNVPKSGEPIYNRRALELTPEMVKRGDLINIKIEGDTQLTKGSSDFRAVINSTPLQIGIFKSDGDGNLVVSAQLPQNLEPGFHTLHLYGPDIFGNQLDMQDVVYVAAEDTDYDGDGIPNDQDSCVIIENSGQDVDEDGIDDACDSLIGEPPVHIASGSTDGSASSAAPAVLAAASSSVFTNPFTQTAVIAIGQASNRADVETSAKTGEEVLGTEKSSSNPARLHAKNLPEQTDQTRTIVVASAIVLLFVLYLIMRKRYTRTDE